VAPPPAFVAPENGYWRYCPQLGAYYPDVTQCPVAWERVAGQ
jgi:hypothetical protein